MDRAEAQPLVSAQAEAATGWAGVWAAFTVLAIAGILSLWAWTDVYAASPLFLSTVGALAAIAYMSTALLLSNRLVVSRSPALVLLASAYLLCGLAVGIYTATDPAVAPGGWRLGPEVSRWFWVVWHGASALGIIGFVAVDDEWSHRRVLEIPVPSSRDLATRIMLRDAGAFMRGPLLLAFTLVVGFGVWIWRANGLFAGWFGGGTLPPVFVAVLLFLDLTAIGLLAVALRRDNLVRAWLLLAAVASLLDVTASSWSGGPSTIGWYFAQACALVSAVVLPLVLLGDLRARLCAAVDGPDPDPTLLDPATGFYNERGLLVQFGRMAQLAVSEKEPLTLAVVRTTGDGDPIALLRTLFRGSDMVAYTGPHEFTVILTPGSRPSRSWLKRRMPASDRLSVGLATCDAEGPRPLNDLLQLTLRSAREDLADL